MSINNNASHLKSTKNQNRSLPRKSVVRLTDRPDMTLDVYRGRKTKMQQQQQQFFSNDVGVNKNNNSSAFLICTVAHINYETKLRGKIFTAIRGDIKKF